MPRWNFALVLLAALVAPDALQATSRLTQASSSSDHISWVGATLTRMRTIKPGMTRADLLEVFTTEGGIFNRLHRTFVSRDCPYFKVDVDFELVGLPFRDANGRMTEEDKRDIIVKISRPYLQGQVMD